MAREEVRFTFADGQERQDVLLDFLRPGTNITIVRQSRFDKGEDIIFIRDDGWILTLEVREDRDCDRGPHLRVGQVKAPSPGSQRNLELEAQA